MLVKHISPDNFLPIVVVLKIGVVLIGFGNVGRELSKILAGKAEILKTRANAEIEVRGIAVSRGYVVLGQGWRKEILGFVSRYEAGDRGFLREAGNPLELVDLVSPDLAFIAIPPSYVTGEPNLTIYRGLLQRGVGFITADKTGLALRYSELVSGARRRGIYVGYRATVMAGTPAIDVIRGLAGREIRMIKGILNATTNYILSLVEKGVGFDEAISRAVAEKLAEPEPSIDIMGLDPSAKLAILVNEAGINVSVNDIRRIPLTSISEDEIRKASRSGKRVKYTAIANIEEKVFSTHPEILEPEDPLSKVSGNYNGLLVEVEGERISLIGPAGPAWRAASAMITDLIEYLTL